MTDIDPTGQEWRLVREESLPGPLCMALDVVAAETAANGGPRTVRVYQWQPSTLSLGYHQRSDDIDWTFCEREGITVTRRPTGGGAIYHDEYGDISYSIIAPAAELPGDLMASYEQLCQPLLDGCAAMGVPADFAHESADALYEPACYLRDIHPAHDIIYEGGKLSGNAQYRRRDSVIQHGSLTYHATPERTRACFATPDVSLDRITDRITAIDEHSDISRQGAVGALEDALERWADAKVGTWTDEELERAAEIATEKFGAEMWNQNATDPIA
ncbi:lipoate--protein ligase family protein [Halocatena pleomorpha]|uniref:Lipoate--protein ligase family protein n=1 Tax=Halocatena pleomorpha TaxID=1785090 RepID=A0A3P3RHY2_9EURY|nr:biotin/lipoate A/B protein ligase family protein [Halocatena pleomorpha]RRJ33081.1 lipoate--protein ligase family protein [Halocatena pleomorpha]